MQVTKSSGITELYDESKIYKVVSWACRDTKINPKQIIAEIQDHLQDGMSTSDIQAAVVKVAADKITIEQPDFQYVAARLKMFGLRKHVYGCFTPDSFYTHIVKNTKRGVYDKEILQKWSEQEINELDDYIDHNKDMDFSYAGAMQVIEKYLVKDRSTGEIFETPQFAYMLIGMCLNQEEPDKVTIAKKAYDKFASRKLSLPTPIMGGVRTPTRQFSSCFPVGAPVYTDKGLVPIEEVKIGSKVLTSGGTYEAVYANTSKTSAAKSFVSIRNCFSIPWQFESTSDHQVVALKRYNENCRKSYSVPEWVEAGELEVGDFVKIPFNKHISQQTHFELPIPDGHVVDNGYVRKLSTDVRKRSGDYDDKVKPCPYKIEINNQFMRILGYFLAEGHINKNSNSICFTFSKDEDEWHEDIIEYFNGLGLSVSSHYTNKNARTLLVYSLPFKKLLNELVGTGFDKKIICDSVMRLDPELQKHLLAGVIRGDGCVHRNGMLLGMCNKTLIHQLGLICLRNGFYPNLGINKSANSKKSWAKNDTFTLTLGKQEAHRDFIKKYVRKNLHKIDLDSKPAKKYGYVKWINGDYFAKVMETKNRPNDGELVYDLSVDNDHTFTVAGVCVHNCVLIDAGDSLDGIYDSAKAIGKYISKRAGIGINGGRIRAEGSRIRSGEVRHTGVIPFWKHFQTAVKSCSQGGLRGGAATNFYPLWHLEFEKLVVLKNNRGIEENRIRHMDYGVQINDYLYERLINDGYITLFSPEVLCGQLYESFFSDKERFKELYEQLESDPSVRKKRIRAIDVFSVLMSERASTARSYIMNVDNCNNKTFNTPIYMSNLCVAPETMLLTDKGYRKIEDLENQEVTVWNGVEWSESKVVKTSDSSSLIKVTTDNFEEIECTPYHKFYVSNDYGKPAKEVRAHELKVGDKLEKFTLPVIEGGVNLKHAWDCGFYSGDGCLVGDRQRIYLYGEKRGLLDKFTCAKKQHYIQEEHSREYFYTHDLEDKFFVPNEKYTIESRLKWLAGFLDADGCVYRNGTNEALTAASNNLEFLKEMKFMLSSLGVSAKIRTMKEAGKYNLPANDGSGENKLFDCKTVYRLLISSVDSQKLLELGLVLQRLVIEKRKPQRDAKQFCKVASVVNEGRIDKTYCLNEPKRNKVMFNGILTGNCMEILLPTTPFGIEKEAEIALCTLMAFNLGEVEYEEIEELAEIAVRTLDNLLDYQDYPVKEAERAKQRRSLGIGVTNYAYFLAKNGTTYNSPDSLELTHKWFEKIQYSLLKASNELAKEKGACGDFGDTNYSRGQLPIDWYEKSVDELVDPVYYCNWELLREEISRYGLRNSTLTALMPSESSSQVHNATNGIEPPRGKVSVKSSKDGVFNQVVPDVENLGDAYEYTWQMAKKGNKGYLGNVCVMQKFVDQSISANTNYDPKNHTDDKIPLALLLEDLLFFNYHGGKTLYYHNTRDGADGSEDVDIEEVCETCTI